MIAVEISTPICILSQFTSPFTGEIIFDAHEEVDSDILYSIYIINSFSKEYPTDAMMDAVDQAICDCRNGLTKSLEVEEVLSLWFTYSEIEIIEHRNTDKLQKLANAIS